SPEELAIREVNTGIYAFRGGPLLDALGHLGTDNAQGELYLPEVLPLVRDGGGQVMAHIVTDSTLTLQVNDRVDLARVRAFAQARIHRAHALAGVTIVEPSSFLHGSTTVGARCSIGPLTTLIDTTVGDEVTIPHSYVNGAELGDRVSVGPFAYLRPGARLRDGAKAGTFVEIKNATVGEQSKVPHLSYIGDADIGEGSNIGAGTITANYDGRAKHRTAIGSRVRVSVGTTFVAPVSVGDDAYTGAGSVITDDVPAGALGIARERQQNLEGYAQRAARKER
ncbi:MAG: UDP-N-acetylglucosamine diphosphorylase/glucosamine-1-phosphate N-acetyltransferase, partial [Actinomycetota bacterium]|nr:UDP-N-acetylglucosamine diphosphorylase/glucosamine-1-phosphate N-acetyltransferase [Actinomycetota bacterium]